MKRTDHDERIRHEQCPSQSPGTLDQKTISQDRTVKNLAKTDTIPGSLQPARHRTLRVPDGDERGSATAELVVMAPLLFFMVFGIVQFALFEHAAHIAEAAAAQGVATARLQGSSAAAGRAEAEGVLGQIGQAVLVAPQVTATRSPTTVTVVVTGHAEGVVPFLSLPVRATMSGAVERFTTNAASAGP